MSNASATQHGIPQWTRGDRMRKARETADIRTADMAAYFERDRKTINNWESDRTDPGRAVVMQWALRCGVPHEWIESGATPEGPDTGDGLVIDATGWFSRSAGRDGEHPQRYAAA